MMNPLVDSASGRLSAALLLTKNKGRDTIKKNVKPEGSVPPWKIRGTSAQNAAEKRATP